MITASLKLFPSEQLSFVSRHIYGQFSEHLGRCIYDGIYVGAESDIPNKNGISIAVTDALKELQIPVLRWPGGCFADEYHWKNGIGSERHSRVNSFWGGVTDTNEFGTHEFFELCDILDCEPYIAANLGSGTVQEMADWVEYMTYENDSELSQLRRSNGRDKPWKVNFFGIGNENWGGGGSMTPEYYSDEYRRYQCFCKDYSGNKLFKIACGPNADDYNWTEVLMKKLNTWHTNAISLHYYTVPKGSWDVKGDALDFTDEEYYQTVTEALKIDEIITKHKEIMSKYDPNCDIKLVVDEWGCWYDVEKGSNPAFLYQQNTMRDAITAASTLNILNKHTDRVVMANLAQAVNVLQALVLTRGAELVKTPTYYIFKQFIPHMDSQLIRQELISDDNADLLPPALSCSATIDECGTVFLTAANCRLDEDIRLEIDLINVIDADIVTAENVRCFNDFGKQEQVTLKEYSDYDEKDSSTTLVIPRCSVVSIRFGKCD